jgi:hypothetical protein
MLDLAEHKAALTARRDAQHIRRDEVSYRAMVGGDPDAKQQLGEIKADLRDIEFELDALAAAQQEHDRRQEDSRRAAAAAAERENAAQLLALSRELQACGPALDSALAEAAALAHKMCEIVSQLRSLGKRSFVFSGSWPC